MINSLGETLNIRRQQGISVSLGDLHANGYARPCMAITHGRDIGSAQVTLKPAALPLTNQRQGWP